MCYKLSMMIKKYQNFCSCMVDVSKKANSRKTRATCKCPKRSDQDELSVEDVIYEDSLIRS